MIEVYDGSTLRAALDQPLAPELAQLLQDRWSDAVASQLEELTHILVVQPGDTEDAIQEAIGFTPLANPMDGARYGSAEFVPYWSWLQDVGGWYKMIVTIGNDGFAFLLLIHKAAGVLPELTQLCAEFSSPA